MPVKVAIFNIIIWLLTVQTPNGIYNTSAGYIDVDEGVPNVTLYFSATVPITCACEFGVGISTTSALKRSSCSITFSYLDSMDENQTLEIKVVETPGIISRFSQLKFTPVRLPNTLWDEYQMPTIPVGISLRFYLSA